MFNNRGSLRNLNISKTRQRYDPGEHRRVYLSQSVFMCNELNEFLKSVAPFEEYVDFYRNGEIYLKRPR